MSVAFGPLDRIQKAFEKADYEKAFELIEKGYEKDPENPGFYYYHAKLFFTKAYPRFDADSARIMITKAKTKLGSSSDEVKSELLEDGVEEEMFQKLGIEIRDFQYQGTMDNLTIEAISDFFLKYPEDNLYRGRLIYKRDSMVFRRVRRSDTKEGYIGFIRNYPNSIFKTEADSLLDKLRYLDLVNSGNLKDYLEFRSSYPSTNMIEKVEEYILKVSTAAHSEESLRQFIETAKTKKWIKMAADVLYYLQTDSNTRYHPSSDSLQNTQKLTKSLVFPIMDHNLFGFHNTDGGMQIDYAYDEVQEKLKCTIYNDQWIFVKEGSVGKIILKDGKVILSEVDAYENISDALALIDKNGYRFLYHKSGFRIIDEPIESAEVFENGWIKVARNDMWGLYTMLGLQIADVRYDDIDTLGSYWVFQKGEELALYTKQKILEEIEKKGLDLEFKFDDLELINNELLIGFKKNRECLLDDNLNFLIPWGEYEVHPDPSGWYLKSDDGYLLYNNTDERIINTKYEYLESTNRWLALKAEMDWILIPRAGQMNPKRGYDSIKLVNPGVLLFKDETVNLVFNNGSEIVLDDHEVRSFQQNEDYLLIKKDGSLGLYNENGESIFDGKYDDIKFVNDSLLSVTKDNKQGIITIDGEFVLNLIFETLDVKGDLILTLYDGAIGCYDLSNRVAIAPEFESRISKVGELYLGRKEGKYGLIDASMEEVLGFKYEEIRAWNDTSYLVSDEGAISILNTKEDTLVQDINGLDLLFQNHEERIYKYVQDGKFGLISTSQGVILKPEYSDIFNIGDENDPIFFADQHLSNAGYHVVSYVNKEGELIVSKAYNKAEFDLILCEEY